MVTQPVLSQVHRASLQPTLARIVDPSASSEQVRPNADGDGYATLTVPALTAVAYLKSAHSWVKKFPVFDITLDAQPFTALSQGLPADGLMQIVLVDLDELDESEKLLIKSIGRDFNCAWVGLTDAMTYQELRWLDDGFDSVGPATSSPGGIAWIIRSAYVQYHEKRRFSQQISELHEKMRQKELIARAKSIMAEHGKTTETEALGQLRSEARKQRRPMWQLAQLIIDAHSIMCPKANQQSSDSTLFVTTSKGVGD